MRWLFKRRFCRYRSRGIFNSLLAYLTPGSHRSHSHCLTSLIDLKRHKGIFVPSTSFLRRSSAGYSYKNNNDRKSRKSAGDDDDVPRTLSFPFSTASPQHKEASVEERGSAQKKCCKLKPDSPGYVLVKQSKFLCYLSSGLGWITLFKGSQTKWRHDNLIYCWCCCCYYYFHPD